MPGRPLIYLELPPSEPKTTLEIMKVVTTIPHCLESGRMVPCCRKTLALTTTPIISNAAEAKQATFVPNYQMS